MRSHIGQLYGLIFILTILLLNSCKEYKKYYYPDGSLKSRMEIKNGELNGIVEYFHENGELRLKGNQLNGLWEGEFIRYYPSGVIEGRESYANDKLNGFVFQYDSLGNLEAEAQFVDGLQSGKLTEYFGDGTVKSEQEFLNGVLHGTFTSYFKGGGVRMKALAEMDKTMYFEKFDSLGHKIDQYWKVIVEGPEEVTLGQTYRAVIRLPGPKDDFETSIKFYDKNVIDEEVRVWDYSDFTKDGKHVTGLSLVVYWNKGIDGEYQDSKQIEGTDVMMDNEKQGIFEYSPKTVGPHLFRGVYFLVGKGGPDHDLALVRSYPVVISFNVKADSDS